MTDGSAPSGAGGPGQPALTTGAVARALNGELRGDPELVVSAIAPLDRAGPSDLTFLANARYTALAVSTRAGALLVSPELADVPSSVAARIVVPKPHDALIGLIPSFYRPAPAVPGVHRTAIVGRGVKLGDGVAIGAHVVIGDGAELGERVVIEPNVTIGAGVRIGRESRVYANATLYPGTVVGRRVLVHSGVRLGSDGFGYVYRDGGHQKIPHVGRCIVEDDVEIGANTTIDRGSIDDTVVGAGTKIDNLVQVGHNARIGRLCLLMAQVGVAGSCRVEDGAILAGQAGLAGHITIGRGARVGAQAGVFGDIPAGETWSGYPARPHREALRAQAAMFRIGPLMRQLERLVRRDAGNE